MADPESSFFIFEQQAKLLFETSPDAARLVIKYRHVDGACVVRATDDKTHIKFITSQSEELRKIERLHAWVLANMVGAV